MKLRTRGNSLRLRLTRPEVAAVGRGERLEEVVSFAPGERLVYALECAGHAVNARFAGGCVTVQVPAREAAEWSVSDRVGIEAEQPVEPGVVLRILIEKDFACLTAREGEDDADAFPNPHERC
jgi:hypothetical protein